jgi:hypothetical protein
MVQVVASGSIDRDEGLVLSDSLQSVVGIKGVEIVELLARRAIRPVVVADRPGVTVVRQGFRSELGERRLNSPLLMPK